MIDFAQPSQLLQDCWRYLVLGLVQGLTEFLPISSTAHLRVVPMIFGWEDPGVTSIAVIQLGSILAVVAYFKKDLGSLLKGISFAIQFGKWRAPEARLGFAIVFGTFPIVIAGASIKLFWQGYENSFFRSIPSIALVSILMAFLLGLAERIGSRDKSIKNVSGIDGFIVGLGQMFALIPGVSRSGITFTASLLAGWSRADGARFSFLLGIPAITLAGLAELKEALQRPINEELLPLLIGIISAAFVSWLAIDWLLKYLQRNSLWIFVAYRLCFGFLLLTWWFSFRATMI